MSDHCSAGTYRINGEHIPVEQVDEFDGDLILSTDVTRAVNEGFDFADIWRHVSVEVDSDEETFTATVVACEIEHGMAAIRLTDLGVIGMQSDGTEHDDLRNCPACAEFDAPVERLGQRVRDDNVMVVGWRCLSCESSVSELIGEGKISDMIDRQPKVGEPVTDGGVPSSRGTDRDGCPYCGDTNAPITSHYPPFCNLYHKEKFQDQIRDDEREIRTDGGNAIDGTERSPRDCLECEMRGVVGYFEDGTEVRICSSCHRAWKVDTGGERNVE